MFDVVAGLLGFLVVTAILAWVFVIPLVTLLRTRRVAELGDRLDRLEKELALLRRAEGTRPAARVEAPAEPAEADSGSEILTAIPAEPRPRRRPRPRLPLAPRTPDAATLEAWIGRQGLGWAAVVLLLFATAFFLKYAFENRWIGELGRVSLGILAGAALCLAGFRYHRRGWRVFSQMLTAAGVVLLYLATFSAFGYYHLIPQERAAVFLVALVAEAVALAVLYEAPAIALMAVVGGLLTPLLLHTDRDQYRGLFTYLVVLDAGVVLLTFFRRWAAVATVALVGTQALFWGWYAEHYHPEKLAAALTFQAVVFVLFLAQQAAGPLLRRRDADAEGLVRLVLNAFLFAAAGYVLLNEDYHVWLGTAAVGLATVYAALGWLLLRRRPEDPLHLLVVVATGLAFLAMVFPLQAQAAWIALGWAAEGLALWWFGLRVESRPLRVLGGVLLLLAAGRVVFVDTPWNGRDPFVPVFNRYGLPALAVAGCVVAAALASRRYLRRPDDLARAGQMGAGLVGVLLVWLVLSFETYQFFTSQRARPVPDLGDLEWVARMSLSVLWAGYAAVVLALGFRLDSRPLRWTALGLFGLTLGKVVLVDMAGLSGFYRVAAFFALSVMMGLAAWGYQKIDRTRWAARAEVTGHEKV